MIRPLVGAAAAEEHRYSQDVLFSIGQIFRLSRGVEVQWTTGCTLRDKFTNKRMCESRCERPDSRVKMIRHENRLRSTKPRREENKRENGLDTCTCTWPSLHDRARCACEGGREGGQANKERPRRASVRRSPVRLPSLGCRSKQCLSKQSKARSVCRGRRGRSLFLLPSGAWRRTGRTARLTSCASTTERATTARDNVGEKMGEKERKEGGRKGGPFVTSPELCVGSLHPPSLCYVLLFHVTERAGRAGEIREFITQFSFGLINANYKRASVRSW